MYPDDPSATSILTDKSSFDGAAARENDKAGLD